MRWVNVMSRGMLLCVDVTSCGFQVSDNLDREKKIRSDVEKSKRKVENELKMTQETVEELDRMKHELEEGVRR